MKILVLGGGAGPSYIVKQLLKDTRIDIVYLWQAVVDAEMTSRYIPCNISGRSFHNIPEKLVDMLEVINIDLILSCAISFSIDIELQLKIKEKKIPALMASKFIANLEWSKIAGKVLLIHLKIPTASYEIIKRAQLLDNMLTMKRPYVIKYEQDSRAGEETIIVTDDNYQQISNYIGSSRSMKNFNGNWSDLMFVVEKFIKGNREYSYHALVNSKGWKFIGASRDYKKRYEGDLGHNTVGMGAYSLGSNVDPIVHEYADKIISYLSSIGEPFLGVLYLGIMIDERGIPTVLEINTRFGDPEIFTILPKINNNLLDLLYNTALDNPIEDIEFNNKSAVAVRIVNKDYHASNTTRYIDCNLGSETSDIEISVNSIKTVLHSVVSTSADTIIEASDKIYKFLETKCLGDYTYRKDIGYFK